MKTSMIPIIVALLFSPIFGKRGSAAPVPPAKWPREYATLKARADYRSVLLFSPDGRILASAGDDGTVRLWNAVDGKSIAIFHYNPDLKGNGLFTVSAIAFSPDGRLLATGGRDGFIKLGEIPSGKVVAALKGHEVHARAKKEMTGGVHSLAFSPDGKTLASAGSGLTVHLWDLDTHSQRKSFRVSCRSFPYNVFYGARDVLVLVSEEKSHPGRVSIRRLESDEPPMRCEGEVSVPGWFVLGNGGRTLVSLSDHGCILHVWDTGTGKHLTTLTIHGIMLGAEEVVASADCKLVACRSQVAGRNGSVYRISLYEIPSGRLLGKREDFTYVYSLALSPDGHFLAAGCQDNIKLWRLPARFPADPEPQKKEQGK